MKHFLLFLSGILCLGFVFTTISYATPPVFWSPQKITEELLVGENREVTVQLSVGVSGRNLNIHVVPELSGVLSVNPNYIASVNAGVTVPITLKFNIASTMSAGHLDGVIQVKSGKRTLAKPLPVLLNIIDRPLRDIDNDGDGVWDDIQAFIDQRYANDPALRNGFRQYMVAVQEGILNAADLNASLTAATKMQRAIECLYALQGAASIPLTDEMDVTFLNSDYRSRAYLMFNEQMGGQVFPGPNLSDLISSCQGQY